MLRKAKKLFEKENIEVVSDWQTRLEAKNYLDCDLFSEEGLQQEEEEEEIDDGDKKEDVFVEVPSSRLAVVFVSGSVVNLSRMILMEYQTKLLSRGLKFSPTPRDIDKSQLKLDVVEFKRKMRLKWYFRDNNDNTNGVIGSNYANNSNDNNNDPSFYIKSGWNPLRADPILESNVSLLEKEALPIRLEGSNFRNLSTGERQVLYELRSYKNIVIKEADKGSAVVVWRREDYCAEDYRQLDNSSVYEELDGSPYHS